MNVNKVILAGYLTNDPILRFTANGTGVASFGLATNRRWKDSMGEVREEALFHNVSVFGNQAEPTASYLSKGQLAYVEGRLSYDKWIRDGVEHTSVKIIAERVQFGPKRQTDGDDVMGYFEEKAKMAAGPSSASKENMDIEPDE
jgi:single-strand DNA-binding protein